MPLIATYNTVFHLGESTDRTTPQNTSQCENPKKSQSRYYTCFASKTPTSQTPHVPSQTRKDNDGLPINNETMNWVTVRKRRKGECARSIGRKKTTSLLVRP